MGQTDLRGWNREWDSTSQNDTATNISIYPHHLLSHCNDPCKSSNFYANAWNFLQFWQYHQYIHLSYFDGEPYPVNSQFVLSNLIIISGSMDPFGFILERWRWRRSGVDWSFSSRSWELRVVTILVWLLWLLWPLWLENRQVWPVSHSCHSTLCTHGNTTPPPHALLRQKRGVDMFLIPSV